ncbi:MAG: ketopantoate reductase family protein [Holdemanella sp.]|nr:ketopantoate reductase family protein [Holdemanella sp.]
MIQNVGLIGRGAVGTLFGTLIQKELNDDHFFVLVDECRKKRYETEDYYCNKEKVHFHYVSKPEECPKLDFILIVTKFPALQSSLEVIKPFVHEDTIIISLLNGIVSEGICEDYLGKGIVLHSIAQLMDATKTQNEMVYTKVGEIVLGTPYASRKKYLEDVYAFLDRVHIPYVKSKDILHDQWSKLMFNCGINQICCVYQTGYGGCHKEGSYRQLLVDAMKEVQTIAKYEGIELSDEEVYAWVYKCDKLHPESMPSMAQDRLAKRKTEVDLFSKTMLDLARKHHIEAPINTFFYQEIKKIEENY